MGLMLPYLEILIRERMYQPLTGSVLLVGRQTIYCTPTEILALLSGQGVDVSGVSARDLEIDRGTRDRYQPYAGQELITDRALFRLLGASHILAIDHSDYEGADIVHDLTKPVPPDLRNIADVIVDGSTLDNVFDPAMALRNYVEMLRPGGRLFMANVFSNDGSPYNILPPLWYLDYFVVNGFVDCKVYISVGTKPYNVFTIDIEALLDPARSVSAFASPYSMTVYVLAEKGKASTSGIVPAQQQYRSKEQWVRYRDNLRRMNSGRPHVCRSAGDILFYDVKGGHLFVDTAYRALDPMTEIRRLHPEM